MGYDLNFGQIRYHVYGSIVFFTISQLFYSVKDLDCVKVKRMERWLEGRNRRAEKETWKIWVVWRLTGWRDGKGESAEKEG